MFLVIFLTKVEPEVKGTRALKEIITKEEACTINQIKKKYKEKHNIATYIQSALSELVCMVDGFSIRNSRLLDITYEMGVWWINF